MRKAERPTALLLRREFGYEGKQKEIQGHRNILFFRASAVESKKQHFCEQGANPTFYLSHVTCIPVHVNQFVNHREVETGGWPLD
tara:strand:+ start:3537 stop:3791 length:255 start_codon:yes stop_codon:yes gene_type:complete